MKVNSYVIRTDDICVDLGGNGVGGIDIKMNIKIKPDLKTFITQDFMEEIVEFAQGRLVILEDKLSDKELDEIGKAMDPNK